MIDRRLLLTGLVGAPAWVRAGHALAQGALPPSLEELTREPAVADASLSPDGSRVALLSQEKTGDEVRSSILILDVRGQPKALNTIKLGFGTGEWVQWANPDRLLISFSLELGSARKVTGARIAQQVGRKLLTRRVMAIGADGSEPVVLFENAKKVIGRNLDLSDVTDLTPDDPRTVLMQAWDIDRRSLFKVDVYTGASLRIERGAPSTGGFATQAGTPVLRYDWNLRGDALRILARAPGESEWSRIAEQPARDLFGPTFDVLATAAEPGMIYVRAARSGDPARAIWRYDLRSKSFVERVHGRPDLDALGAVFDDDGAFVGASYLDDRLGYAFVDRSLQAHFKGLNAFFDDSCNVRIADLSRNRRRFLLWVSGPQEPGGYYLYDLDRKGVETLAQSRPWLSPERLAKVRTERVTTRDGRTLRAYLTVPLNAQASAPLVVMPHGGPEARDHVDFDLWAQVLAAQGWYVVQPQFRGSDGFGRAFAEAGHRQWGGQMQDDITDTVAHMLASGRIDPKRVAIFGWSYGGYSALMGAAKTPELYAAVAAGAAPTDLIEILSDVRKAEDTDFGVYDYWLRVIGDPRTERLRLERESPRRRAADIKAPVLLAHGADDGRVAVSHSRNMRKALQDAGKSVTYLEYEGEGHTLEPEADAKFLKALVSFLKSHLG
jgi:dipeptidyl aminopeptidase/acylaminoacyl peptidase